MFREAYRLASNNIRPLHRHQQPDTSSVSEAPSRGRIHFIRSSSHKDLLTIQCGVFGVRLWKPFLSLIVFLTSLNPPPTSLVTSLDPPRRPSRSGPRSHVPPVTLLLLWLLLLPEPCGDLDSG